MFDIMKKFASEFISESNNRLTDSKADYSKTLKNELKPLIKSIVGQEYHVKYSVGQGNKTYYPWIAIFKPEITTSAQKGIYIVYLFRRDLKGVYLSLNQGITNFINLYGNNAYTYARQVVSYFQTQIESSRFQKSKINLQSRSTDKGFGYEQTNIISKYYNFSENNNEIVDDLIELLKIYETIYDSMSENDYQTIIDIIVQNENPDDFYDVDQSKEIMELLISDDQDNKDVDLFTLSEVQVPIAKKKRSFTRIEKRKVSKIDYIKKAKRDSKLGLIGEISVLEYEKNRLVSIGLRDYIDRVKWVSKESDQFGYDIKSVDYIDGKIEDIFIEVKTTKSKGNQNFFVSQNELKVSMELNQRYYVYRIHEVEGETAKLFIKSGRIDDNFDITPHVYSANIKDIK